MSWHLSPMQRFLPYMVLYLRLDSKKKTILFFYRPIVETKILLNYLS
jgi:hypothetical protein